MESGCDDAKQAETLLGSAGRDIFPAGRNQTYPQISQIRADEPSVICVNLRNLRKEFFSCNPWNSWLLFRPRIPRMNTVEPSRNQKDFTAETLRTQSCVVPWLSLEI